MAASRPDLTLPGRYIPAGPVHPVTRVMDEIIEIFEGLGFSVAVGPEVETDYYNFAALNFPDDHPARDMQDTLHVSKDALLRHAHLARADPDHAGPAAAGARDLSRPGVPP